MKNYNIVVSLLVLLPIMVYADNKKDCTVKGNQNVACNDVKGNLTVNNYYPKSLPTKKKLKTKVKPKIASSAPENKFTIMGATNEEKYLIESELNRLKVLSARIIFTQSVGDKSRDVDVMVTYQDNTQFRESYNSAKPNAAIDLIDLIIKGETKK